MNQRRIGRFTVADKLLLEAINTGQGANLFARAVPLDIRRDFISARTEYVCWHPAFDEIHPAEIAPEYVAEFTHVSNIPTWKRVRGAA